MPSIKARPAPGPWSSAPTEALWPWPNERSARATRGRDGWSRIALELWATQRETALEALRRSGKSTSQIAAIGIANQRETTIVWDRATSQPVAPAIVWQDRRTADRCAELRAAGAQALVRRKTGLVLDPYFSATKLAWILASVPGARDRAARGELAFGTVDSWLVWQLSGGRLHVTDATNASRTLLYDLRRGDWDDELLELFGVPRAMLPGCAIAAAWWARPRPRCSAGRCPWRASPVTSRRACSASLRQPGHDQGHLRHGVLRARSYGRRTGTSGSGLLTTVALQRNGRRAYALEGSAFIGGAAIQWLRDGLGIINEASECAALAVRVPESEGVYFVPRSPALARRTGNRAREERSWVSRGAVLRPTSPEPRLRASPSR